MVRVFHRLHAGRPVRVVWVLEELGEPYELTVVRSEDRGGDEHRRRHPLGRVPVLELDEGFIFESAAICLQPRRPAPAGGAAARARQLPARTRIPVGVLRPRRARAAPGRQPALGAERPAALRRTGRAFRRGDQRRLGRARRRRLSRGQHVRHRRCDDRIGRLLRAACGPARSDASEPDGLPRAPGSAARVHARARGDGARAGRRLTQPRGSSRAKSRRTG